MIDGNASEFIDKLYYEDHYVTFHGTKYFANGCCHTKDTNGNTITVTLEVYDLDAKQTVFSVTLPSAIECITAFEQAAIWDGKTFWEAESEITWVDE